MDIVLCDITALEYWRQVSWRSGIAAVGGLAAMTPSDLTDLAEPARRRQLTVRPPTVGAIEHLRGMGVLPEKGTVHVMVGNRGSRRFLRGVVCHLWQRAVPSRSLFPVMQGGKMVEGAWVCAPEFALLQLDSAEHSLVDRVLLGMELCGTYRLNGDEAVYGCERVMSVSGLQAFLSRMEGTRGHMLATRAAQWTLDGSASPAESSIAASLSLPLRYGGSGLGVLELNRRIELNGAAASLLGRDAITPDGYFSEAQFAYEYNSTTFHSDDEERAYDELRSNTYMAMGIGCAILRPRNLASVDAYEKIVRSMRGNLHRRLDRMPAGYDELHEELLEQTLAAWAHDAERAAEDLRDPAEGVTLAEGSGGVVIGPDENGCWSPEALRELDRLGLS